MSDEKKPDQFAVLKADIEDEPYRVDIKTIGKFTIPHVNAVNIFDLNDAMDAAVTELDVIINVLRVMMGDEDFKRLRESGVNRPTLFALYAAWEAHCGMREGESPASSD